MRSLGFPGNEPFRKYRVVEEHKESNYTGIDPGLENLAKLGAGYNVMVS